MAGISKSLAHQLDAAWILALWKAIHWGDPAPDFTVGQGLQLQVEALAAQLAEVKGHAPATPDQVIQGLATLGVTVRVTSETGQDLAESAPAAVGPERPKQICVYVPEIKGPVYCYQVRHRPGE